MAQAKDLQVLKDTIVTKKKIKPYNMLRNRPLLCRDRGAKATSKPTTLKMHKRRVGLSISMTTSKFRQPIKSLYPMMIQPKRLLSGQGL